jgi:hypothetical protein
MVSGRAELGPTRDDEVAILVDAAEVDAAPGGDVGGEAAGKGAWAIWLSCRCAGSVMPGAHQTARISPSAPEASVLRAFRR